MTVTIQAYIICFYFLSIMNAEASRSTQIRRKYACAVTVIVQPPKLLQRFLWCHLEINGRAIFSFKRHFHIQFLVLVPDEAEVQV